VQPALSDIFHEIFNGSRKIDIGIIDME